MATQKSLSMQLASAVATVYAVYLLDAQSRNFSAATMQSMRVRVGRFVTWLQEQGIAQIGAVTTADIRRFQLERQGVVSEITLHTEARALRAFLNWCVAESYIAASPMPKMPRKPTFIKTAMTPAQLRRLLRGADMRESAIVLLLLDTGVRASELCSIDVEHIDIANGRIKVRGKWNKERWVYIGARTVKAMLRYWAANGIEQGAAIRNERNERRMTRYGLFRTLQRMGERTRVDGVSPHALRRTFAVFHLRNGVDLYSLARLMGHEDIATLKVYLDLADTDAAEAHRRYTLLDEL